MVKGSRKTRGKKSPTALPRRVVIDALQPADQPTWSQRTTATWCRSLAAQLYLTGRYRSEDIARYFKEAHGIELKSVTIRKYLAQLRHAWQRQAMLDTGTMIAHELARLSQLEEYAILNLRDGDLRITDGGAFVQLGNAKDFCDVMLKISKRRSALLGLDQAPQIAVADKPVSELSDEELERIINTARKESCVRIK